MAKKIYKISQYFLFVHYLFGKSVPLFNNSSKEWVQKTIYSS